MTPSFDSTLFIILTITGICTLILIAYYLIVFHIPNNKSTDNGTNIPISVIVAAKNERENLINHLPSLIGQNYPNFEIVVVNDGSYDGTKELLDQMALKEKKLSIVHIELEEQYQKGKKFALTLGIKAAKYEQLLFTDADCRPCSDQWIQLMANQFVSHDIVLGIAPLNTSNTLLGSIINFETLHTAIQYLGYANKKQTYMGVGRNLGYTKTIFFENKGFASHQHIMSGDDDLFIQEAAKNKSIGYSLDPNSFVYSDSPKKVKQWIKQKIRHLSTSKFYHLKFKLFLGIYALTQLVWYGSIITFLCLDLSLWYWIIPCIGLKWLIQWIIFGKFALQIQRKKIAFALPIYDILFSLYLLFFGIIKPFTKPTTWN